MVADGGGESKLELQLHLGLEVEVPRGRLLLVDLRSPPIFPIARVR